MADEFYRKFGDKCRLRREALREADLERCRLEAHALAGEAGLLDLAGISALASSIERLAGHGLEAGEAEDAVLDRVRGLLDRLLVSAIRAAEAGDEGGEASTLLGLQQELDGAAANPTWWQRPDGETAHTRGRRVLLLDDSEITREAFGGILEDAGFTVASAGTLIEFEALVSRFQPEVILTDINMPEIQGDEICRVLKARLETEGIPIVLISSLPDEELAKRAARAGADGYVSKQHGPERVIELLDDLLSQIIF